jgi:Streptomyces sporulation and cell division protein, SsgA
MNADHGTATDSVQQDMFTVLHGQPTPVVTRWTYRADDPFAVTLGIRTRHDRWVEWMVARELVIDALAGPAGLGDVRMTPQLVQGYDIVEIEIRSAEGRAVLEVDRDLLAHFVDATFAVVPLGGEASRMDLDAELARLADRQ